MIIYKITNTVNGKSYIGQTRLSLEKRWKRHKKDSTRLNFNFYFYNAIRKYGTECWTTEILENLNDISKLDERETYWISYYDTFNPEKGYNSTSGGSNGRIVSENTKQKLSQLHKGKPKSEEHISNIKKSKEHISEETKQKMSQTRKEKNLSKGENNPMFGKRLFGKDNPNFGNKWSDEQKEHLRQINLGKKLSEETKQKMRGRIPWNKKV